MVVIGPKPMKFSDLAYDDTYVADVLFPIRSGKEATVFCCRAQPHTGLSLVAAKVYRPVESRMFRNDALYQQGRHIKDARMRRAFRNKSRTGRRVQYSGWVSSEYETMCILHGCGAAVPKPYTQTHSTIIMEYIGDTDQPAPMLNQIHLPRRESKKLYTKLLEEISLWLACGRVHADLSPFNVLYWRGGFRIIDFPQAVDPSLNPAAFDLLVRDIEILHHYFRDSVDNESAYEIAERLWNENADINYWNKEGFEE